MLEKIKERLGANYKENTDDIIKDIIETMTSIAVDTSNRKSSDKKLEPYIKEAVIAEYNARGSEGFLSRNEGGISTAFVDIVKKLKIDLSSIRLLP